LIWKFETTNFINGSPAVTDSSIIFGGCDALLHIISADNGKERIVADLKDYMPGCPAIAFNRAYTGNYGGVMNSIDLSTGDILWTFGDGENQGPIVSSPAVSESLVVFTSRDKNVYCLNNQTGRPFWNYDSGSSIEGSPVIAGNKVVFGSMSGRLIVLDLITGELLWKQDLGSPLKTSPSITKDGIFIGSEEGLLYKFKELKK